MYPVLLLEVLIASLMPTARAHSWIEQLTVIHSNGTFGGTPGYARGNVPRTSPGFSDPTMVYMLPPSTHASQVLPTDPMCKASQQTQNQTEGSPRLRASPGDAIALRFQENGHVTLPENSPGKPENRGTVYVYGTTQAKDDESFLSVHKVWNQDGTGGDKRGVLLSVQNFDDGRCYQVNGGNISQARQKEYPHEADKLMGEDLWCQQDIALPSNAPAGKPYTLYWVWDWPTLSSQGKVVHPQIYTTCIDVDVTQPQQSQLHSEMKAASPGYANGQSLNSAAIPSQFEGLSSSSTSATQAVPAAAGPSPSPTASDGMNSNQPTQLASTFRTASSQTSSAVQAPKACAQRSTS